MQIIYQLLQLTNFSQQYITQEAYIHMNDINPQQMLLFAKLSKILAETFEDIHKICLNQAGLELNNKQSTAKQDWLNKIQQPYSKDGHPDYDNNQQEVIKPPKGKKSKPYSTSIVQDNNGNKQKKLHKKKKVAKWEQEGRPKPPINAFMLFLRDSKFQIMEAKPQLTPSQVSSYASALWNDLAEEQKEKYRGQYRENKVKYDELVKQFHEKQKLNGKNIKKVVQQSKTSKNVKDILDQEVNLEQSGDSQSMSGI